MPVDWSFINKTINQFARSWIATGGRRLNRDELRAWLERKPPSGSWRDFFAETEPEANQTNGVK